MREFDWHNDDNSRRERQREEIDRAYGDAVYNAWRAGLNSDRVAYEDVQEQYYECYDADEAARRTVDALRPQPAPQPEYEDERATDDK